jgi:hypothetical protein
LAFENGVVAYHLSQYLGVNLDVGLLALYYDAGLCVVVYGHDVGTLCHAVNLYGVLLDNLLWLEVAVCKHKLHDMATHPLFGCEYKPLTSHSVEDLGAAALSAACAKVDGWEV